MSYLAYKGYFLAEEIDEKFSKYCARDGKDPERELNWLVNNHLERIADHKEFFGKLKKRKIKKIITYENDDFIGGHNED